MSKTWTITNTISGDCLGEFPGGTAADALDAMARDAGYADYAAACAETSVLDGEIVVDEKHDPLEMRIIMHATTPTTLGGFLEVTRAMHNFAPEHIVEAMERTGACEIRLGEDISYTLTRIAEPTTAPSDQETPQPIHTWRIGDHIASTIDRHGETGYIQEIDGVMAKVHWRKSLPSWAFLSELIPAPEEA